MIKIMSIIRTTVSPCIRLALVRNAQCQKHLKQQTGDMSDEPGSSSVLTEQGEEMAKALSKLIEYLTKRPYCVTVDKVPKISINIVIDTSAQQHADTSKYLELVSDCKIHHSDNIMRFLGDLARNNINNISDNSNNTTIQLYIVFTNANNIIKGCKISDEISKYLGFGPALGSVTTFDLLPLESGENIKTRQKFVHEFGSLAALQYGGFDTSELFWWNNK